MGDPKKPIIKLCSGTTGKGTPCKRRALKGSAFCKVHGAPPRDPVRGGRPSKLTREIIDGLCENLGTGAYIETCCKAEGISDTVFYDWLKKGLALLTLIEAAQEAGHAPPVLDEHETLLAMFADRIEKADATGEIGLLKNIRAGAPGWQGSAWIAQRRYAKRWGDKVLMGTTSEDDPIHEILTAFRAARAAAVPE